MNLRERLSQIAADAVVADEEYIRYIYTCIVQRLEEAAKQGLLSDKVDVAPLRDRCATNPSNEFEGPRAVAWDDGFTKALDRIACEGVYVDQNTRNDSFSADWSALGPR